MRRGRLARYGEVAGLVLIAAPGLVACPPPRPEPLPVAPKPVMLPDVALDERDILFYAPFDGEVEASKSGGVPRPVRAPKAPVFAAGREGRAIRVGGHGDELVYATEGNIEPEAGTIAIWVRPVGWSDDAYVRSFFNLGEPFEAARPGESSFLILYKYHQTPVYWLLQQHHGDRQTYLVQAPGGVASSFQWRAGTWAHLIGTWAGNQLSLFVDGEYFGSREVPSPRPLRALAATFEIGAANGRAQGTPDTLLDELLILRRPVNRAEAKVIFARGRKAFTKAETLSRPDFEVTASAAPSASTPAEFLLSSSLLGWRPEDLAGAVLHYRIFRSRDGIEVAAGELPSPSVRSAHAIAVRELTAGTHQVRAQLFVGGRRVAEAQTSFEKASAPAWLGNGLGQGPGVPLPWTPLTRRERLLACWGRVHGFPENAAFPTRIATQGRELLTRPITLGALVGGRRVSLVGADLVYDRESDGRIEFHATGSLGSFPVTVRGQLDFDGFLHYHLVLGSSIAAEPIGDLALEVAFDAGIATLVTGRAPAPNSGRLLDFKGPMGNAPIVWIGDPHGGLQWSTIESRDFSDATLGARRSGREVVLRATLVDRAVRPDRPLTFEFALQATPVKPIPAGSRRWEFDLNDLDASPDPSKRTWEFYWDSWNRAPGQRDGRLGYQVATSETRADLLRFARDKVHPWIYWDERAIWAGDPVLKAFGGHWGAGAFDAARSDDPLAVIDADPTLPAVRDYLVWQNWKLLHDNPEMAAAAAGFYLDAAQAFWAHPVPGIRPRGVFTLLGTRELQRRFARMLKDGWPHLLVANHQSGDVNMSQLAFSDMMVTGEHLADSVALRNDLHYRRVLDLDALRAEYGSQFGVRMVFLPEIARAVQGDAAALARVMGPDGMPAARHLAGLLWVHDIIPWYAYVNRVPFMDVGRVKRAFGWDEQTRFVGYWESDELVKTRSDAGRVVTSVFLRDGKVLFVTMNDADERASVSIEPSWRSLGTEPKLRVVDPFNGKILRATGGAFVFPLAARDFQAFVAE